MTYRIENVQISEIQLSKFIVTLNSKFLLK